jgi:alpha/beta superfamily hydrolase
MSEATAHELPATEMAERPVWLLQAGGSMFGFVHEPRTPQPTAVLVCPPFGWDEMCSHRARRSWARALAADGFTTLRIDLPGTGESEGGPHDPDRLGSWQRAIGAAAAWLRERGQIERVVAIGIGTGGMAAVAATASGAPIDDLILWAVPARGRTLVRELKAYAAIVAARYPGDAREQPEDAGLEISGFVMSQETVRALSELDLTRVRLPDAEHRRVLLIERDELGIDRRLQGHLAETGAEVTVLAADDYRRLMAHPQEAQAPWATIRASLAWLRDQPVGARGALVEDHPPSPPAAVERPAARMTVGSTQILETPLVLTRDGRCSYGMLSCPASGPTAPLCVVLLNGGALRRIGPNRTWVELARRWAAAGVPAVRIDFEGIGDSDGDAGTFVSTSELYAEGMTEQTVRLLDGLSDRGLPSRFALVGLCSGAYWALHAALADPRVVGALTINLYSFYWSKALVAERDRRETVAALRGGLLRRALRGGITRYHVRRAVSGLRGRLTLGGSVAARSGTEVSLALDRLRDRGTQVLLALSDGEPLYDEFEREGRLARLNTWPNVTLERLPSADHMLRAIWVQREVRSLLDQSLQTLLDREGVAQIVRPAGAVG